MSRCECVVLAIIQRERDDLVDRHDLRVAQGQRKDAAEFLERGLDAAAGLAAVAHDDRRRFGQAVLVVGPGAVHPLVASRRSATGRRLFPAWSPAPRAARVPSRPAFGSSEPTVTNSVPAARSAGRRTSITEGACTHRLGRRSATVRVLAEERRIRRRYFVSGRAATCAPEWRCSAATRGHARIKSGPPSDDNWRYSTTSGFFAVGAGRRAALEQVLHGVRQLLLFGRRFGRLPAGEQRSRRNHRAGLAAFHRFAVEVPDARVAEAIRVRIAGQHVARHVPGEVPLARLGSGRLEVEFQVGQIARMVAVARPHQQRDQVARLHGQGTHLRITPIRPPCAIPSASRCRVAPRRSSSRHSTPLPHSGWACVTLPEISTAAGDRASPTDGCEQRRRRMHADRVRLHVAWNADVLVGRIGQQLRQLVRVPALDEIVV